MKSRASVFSCLCGLLLSLAAGSVLAGPNSGGTLVVHDTGIVFCIDQSSWPSPAPPCSGVDNEGPVNTSYAFIWKVYAAFPSIGAPRLKALPFAATFDAGVFVLIGGVPDPDLDFEIPQNGWPTSSGGGVAVSFGETQTAHMVDCYWLAGYGYDGSTWSLAPHPVQEMVFIDNSSPPQEDPIVDLGSLGFGHPGYTPCPPSLGACCLDLGVCVVAYEEACAQQAGQFQGEGTDCDPSPCGPLLGGCCFVTGDCAVLTREECMAANGLSWDGGTPCDSIVCPAGGACCLPTGLCWLLTESECVGFGGAYQGDQTDCDPNPCPPPPPSACCFPDGSCSLLSADECAAAGGDSLPWYLSCNPNPCPQVGACCLRDGTCELTVPGDCGGVWIGGACEPGFCLTLEGACCLPDGTCEVRLLIDCELDFVPNANCDPPPNPCPVLDGACCLPDGSCQFLTWQECQAMGGTSLGGLCEPNPCPIGPARGACCFPDGSCLVTFEWDCPQGAWQGPSTDCDPNPCVPTPIERTTWGRIKRQYRG